MRRLTEFIRSGYARMQSSAGRNVPPKVPPDPAPADAQNTDQEQFAQAQTFHRHGQLDKAEGIFRGLLQKYPKDFDLLHFLGVIQGQHNNFACAVAFLEQATAIDPTSAAAHCALGNCLKGLGRHEEALASYDKALALRADDADTLSNRGAALQDLKRPGEALQSYDRALAINPNHLLALDNRGTTLRELKRPEDALGNHDKALAINPDYAPAHYNRGVILADLKRYAEALFSFERALAFNPQDTAALCGKGAVLHGLQRYEEALTSFEQALSLSPQDSIIHFHRGLVLHNLKRHEGALASYGRALSLRPDYVEALIHQSATLRVLNRHEEAIASVEKALAFEPDHPTAYYYRGTSLAELNRYEDALASYDRALAIDAQDSDTHCNRGAALRCLKRYEDALASFERALALKPGSVEALINVGAMLRELNRHMDALACLDRALALDPDNAVAHFNRAIVLGDVKRFEDALKSLDRVLALQPDHVDAHNIRGSMLRALRRYEEALSSYGKGLSINPNHSHTLFNRANLLYYRQKAEDAAKDLERLVALEADFDFAQGLLLNTKMSCCDWRDLNTLWSTITEGVRQGKKCTEPFCCIGISNSPQFLKRCAEIRYTKYSSPASSGLLPLKPRNHDKIRLGYVAGEFRHHATSILMVELFERHDTSRFEVLAFDNGWDDGSDIRNRLESAFTEIVDISRLGDEAAAAAIRNKDIDILVDLNGLVGHNRTGIFSYRPARIQVNWLGFPGTIGVPYMDYIIGDANVIPAGHETYYSEKVVRLPDTYQVNDSRRANAAPTPARAEAKLPDSGFVFCCFNNSYKITPEVFDVWMRLLNKVEHSVLWLLEDNAAVSRNLRSEAAARGVGPERLVFAPRMNLPDHLARHRLADLFLDTLPCNAHTTASDALWAGLPLLTCMGAAFAGRVAGSLLHALGLPELATASLADYEALALKLATTPALLLDLRTRLAENKATYPLFDCDRFRKHLESSYVTMVERWLQGEAPESISVQPLPQSRTQIRF